MKKLILLNRHFIELQRLQLRWNRNESSKIKLEDIRRLLNQIYRVLQAGYQFRRRPF